MKINWELEHLKNFLESKNYVFAHALGSINYTCYVYYGKKNGKRVEIWDDKSGELNLVDSRNKSLKLEEL
jgi:hypothetical protein